MLQRNKPTFLMVSFSILSLLILLLSGCGPQGTQTKSSSGKPVKGGTWIDDLFQEPNSLIPYASTNLVNTTIYAPLFYGDAHGNITPGLATPVPTVQNGGASSDLKTWKITLRPNLKWSDGQPLNADDVDFSWRLWTNPKFPAYSLSGIDLIQSTDISSDKLSITFHLKRAYASFASVWVDGGQAPLPKHHFQNVAPDAITKTSDGLFPQVTSGPFKMTESKPGDHYTVARNPNYYLASQGLPYLDQIVFRVVPNQDTILKDFQAGSVNSSWFLDVTKASTYKSLTNYTSVTNLADTNYERISVNFKNPILGKDQKVRQAIAEAIDYNTLIQTARRGLAKPLCTPHGSGFNPGYQADAPCPKFDLNAANSLLDQDGWTKGTDGYRSKNGQQLAFTYSTTSKNSWRATDEDIIQSDLQKVGIKINIQNYPSSTFFGSFLPQGKHDLAELESQPNYDPNESNEMQCNQFPPRGLNYNYYCNPKVDQLLDQEQQTGDPAQRQQIFDQLHQIYLTEFPTIVLYSASDLAVVKKNGHNYQPGPEGARETVGVQNWWCDGGTC